MSIIPKSGNNMLMKISEDPPIDVKFGSISSVRETEDFISVIVSCKSHSNEVNLFSLKNFGINLTISAQ